MIFVTVEIRQGRLEEESRILKGAPGSNTGGFFDRRCNHPSLGRSTQHEPLGGYYAVNWPADTRAEAITMHVNRYITPGRRNYEPWLPSPSTFLTAGAQLQPRADNAVSR